MEEPKKANLCSMCWMGFHGKCPGVQVITDENGFLSTWGIQIGRATGRNINDIHSFLRQICDKNQMTKEDIAKIKAKKIANETARKTAKNCE